MTDTLNGTEVEHDLPTTILPTRTTTPATTHKLAIDSILGEDITVPLDVTLGQELDLAIRVRVTGLDDRTGYKGDTIRTTRVTLVALHAVDDEPTPILEPALPVAKVVTVDRVPAWAIWAMGSGAMAWLLIGLQYIG